MSQSPDPRSDAELFAALRSHDESAFDTLYRRHRDWVVRVALRIVGDEADALDVLQDAFLYVLRKAPHLEARAKFATFLYPAVRHLALERRRRRSRSRPAVESVSDPDADGSREDLVSALAGLSPELRETVLLRFVDGFSIQEIAARLAVPPGTVKSRLHQAIERLREDPGARRYFLA